MNFFSLCSIRTHVTPQYSRSTPSSMESFGIPNADDNASVDQQLHDVDISIL